MKLPKLADNWTFRQLLGLVGRLYDPMGILTPVTTTVKTLVQRVQRTGVNLNQSLNHQLVNEINEAINSLQQYDRFRVNRYALTSGKQTALAIYCDASDNAYGAVVYAVDFQRGDQITWLCAKRKVVPFKPKHKRAADLDNASKDHGFERRSIAEVELQAASLGSELLYKLSTLLETTKAILFTDNQTVLKWLRMSPTELNVFVRNRVELILNRTSIDQWKYIPTTENPADIRIIFS